MFGLGIFDFAFWDRTLEDWRARQAFALWMLFLALFGVSMTGGELAAPETPAALEPGFHLRTTEVNGQVNRYQVYVPPGYDPAQSTPLLVFLCGMFEFGTDGIIQTKMGVGPYAKSDPGLYPCLILFPQCPQHADWIEDREYFEVPFNEVLNLYNVDRDRIYLTGLSAGGTACYVYGADYPDLWAAIMPVSSEPIFEQLPGLVDTPLYIGHSANDPYFSVENVRAAVEQLEDAGADVRYREYNVDHHNVGYYMYSSPVYVNWFFEHSRSEIE
jgi:predicted peptidase